MAGIVACKYIEHKDKRFHRKGQRSLMPLQAKDEGLFQGFMEQLFGQKSDLCIPPETECT